MTNLETAVQIIVDNPRAGRGTLVEKMGITDHKARMLLREIKAMGLIHTADPDDMYLIEMEDADGLITTRTKHLTSLDQALDYFDVDLDVWKVSKHVINQWGKGDHTQVKVWLSRRFTEAEENGIRRLAERLISPGIPAVPPANTETPRDGHLLVMSLVDHHFGKLCWGEETGEDYDLSIAESLYAGAVVQTLSRCGPFEIDRVLLPVGNDLFHFDTSRGTTANGTQMDVDTRPAKVFVAGVLSVIGAVERILAALPGVLIDVKYVPGNHDPSWGHHLCVALWCRFKNSSRVTVDFSACPDKLVEYKGNLIYLTHGDVSQKNMAQLPAQIATFHPEAWGRSHTREVHMGHYHHERETSFIPTAEYTGTILRILPSLCAADHWHFTKGFKGNHRATLSFLYSQYGLEGVIPVSARRILG